MPSMRSLGLVLTLAFVFASSSLLIPTTAAQSGASLSGVVCAQPSESYPRPVPMGGEQPSHCEYYGQGLPGATVRLTRPGPVASVPVGAFNQTVTTDAEGAYSFTGLQPGNYTLSVNRTGFASSTQTVAVKDGAQRLDVALAGQSVQGKGKVSDPSGSAIAGAEIQFCCSQDDLRAKTGADGRFSATLKAGYWSLYTQAPGYQSSSEYLLIDGASDIALTLQPIPPTDAKVHGVVTDQDGNPVSEARVAASMYGGGCYYATPAEGDGTSSSDAPDSSSSMPPCDARPYYGGENYTFTDSQGRYALGVYSGEGSLYVQKEGYAGYSIQIRVAAGEDQQRDLTIKKFPEKTAHIVGKVTDGKGNAVRYAYLSVNSPEFGIHECSAEASMSGGSSGSPGSVEPAPAKPMAEASYYYDPGCAITMNADGTFEGRVTPGYAIVSVWVDSYRACSETQDSDGDFSRDCGPQYFQWTRSLDLPANATTRIDVNLRARPEPDATVSGYLIDRETGKAIAGAQVSFSNAETYGYGYATTDQDGSYKIRLRSGYHSVYAYAEGYLHWEGMMDISRGGNDVDIEMAPGQESYGGCCHIYASEAYADSGSDVRTAGASAPGAPSPPGMSGAQDQSSDGDSSSGVAYEDLGGGLGPYDAEKRQKELADGGSNGAPPPAAGLLLVALAAAAFAVRRRRA